MNQFDPNKLYPTRGGLWARVLCVDAPGDFPAIGYIDLGGDSLTRSWTLNGRFTLDCESEYDLILTPETRRLACWLNVYEHARHNECWPTKAEADLADRRCNRLRIACIDLSQFEYTAGDGLK